MTAIALVFLVSSISDADAALAEFQIFIVSATMLIPTAALLFLFQRKHGISFLQPLAIFVLSWGYLFTYIGIGTFTKFGRQEPTFGMDEAANP